MAYGGHIEGFLEKLGETLPKWIKRMETGRLMYKMCAHAYDTYSLDAITLAFDLRQMIGIGFTEEEKDEAKRILDSYQLGEDGFFYEKDYKERLANSSVGRVIEMHANYITFQAIGAYKAIDRLPGKAVTFYDQFIEGKGITNYLEKNCPWVRSPWGAGGMVDSLATILSCNIQMGYKDYEPVIDDIFLWLGKNQSQETGLWGSAEWQGINGLINGGYHLMRGTYFTYNRSFKYAEKIIDTIIEDLKTHNKFKIDDAHGCQDMDHFFLLEKCHHEVPGYCEGEIGSAASRRIGQLMESIYCDDGGFSFESLNAVKVHNYYEVSPGRKESDMQGGIFFLQTIVSICRILGITSGFRDSFTHG